MRSVGESIRAVVVMRFRLRGIQLKSAISVFECVRTFRVNLSLLCVHACGRASEYDRSFPGQLHLSFFLEKAKAHLASPTSY